jgi:PAS domain S-box-containing protein
MEEKSQRTMASASVARQIFAPDINTKLRWMICAAPCLVLIVMIAFGAMEYRRITLDNAIAEAADRMDSLASRVHEFFDRAIVLTRSLASRQKALGSAPDPETRRVLVAMLEDTPSYEAQGLYIVFEDRPYHDADAAQWVWRQQVPGTEDHIVRTSDKLTYDYHLKNELTEWYQGAKNKKDGEFFITKPYFDKDNTNVWMVSVTRPIFVPEGGDSRFIGVAGVDLKLDDLTAHLQGGMGEAPAKDSGKNSGYFYLFSSAGIAYGLPAKIRETLGAGRRPALRAGELRDALPEIDSVYARSESPLIRFRTRDGRSRLVSWKRISPDFDDKVVLSLPEAAVYGPAFRATLLSIGTGVLALAVMIGLVTTIADRYLSRPISRLTAAAEAVQSGDYSPGELGTLVVRRDEFGQLARGFRQMVKEVAAREQELKSTQKELARSERHYRALFENAMDIIAVIGADGTVRYESPSVERILGYPPDELIGRKVDARVHPDDRALLTSTFQELTSGPGGERTIEFRLRHKDGTWRMLEAKCTTLTDESAVLGIVVNGRDITERKRNEDAIRQLNANLDHRVRLRTAELEHTLEELRAAKEAAERATKQMEDFATGVAHDMRNLLMIIIGYGEDLLRRAVKQKIDAFIPDLKLIANKGNELIELLDDLLHHSKAMSGKDLALDLDEFGVAEVIRARMEGIELIAQKNGNTVKFVANTDLGTMIADEVKVSRILLNLLTNACKFTKNGEITLTVTRERSKAGDWIVFQIADTGIGMSAEQVAKLFDRFSQVHAQSGLNGMGFGLGLANSLLYCEAMGGTITVESEVGRGTTFAVRLPAVVRVLDRPAATASGAGVQHPAHSAPRASAANLILIIDDDALITELLARNLGDEGFQTLTACSGEDGLRLAKQAQPSAIILDVVMPGTDGWAVLAALRADPDTSRIPVIMASILDERERGMQMGALAYVTKPLSRDRLAGILHKHFGACRGARILLLSAQADLCDTLLAPIVAKGFELVTASDGNSALNLIRARKPDLILLDLPPDTSRGGEFIDSVRNNPDWDSIPIIVMSAAELGTEDRRALQDRLEKMLRTGVYNREELLREISVMVQEHRQNPASRIPEQAHA